MELKDTIKMMDNADYKERFRAEYFQLKIRGDKLEEFLLKYKAGELNFKPTCSYDFLTGQLRAMELYLSYLEGRARIEGIDLVEL
jgi:hypothetical protein